MLIEFRDINDDIVEVDQGHCPIEILEHFILAAGIWVKH